MAYCVVSIHIPGTILADDFIFMHIIRTLSPASSNRENLIQTDSSMTSLQTYIFQVALIFEFISYLGKETGIREMKNKSYNASSIENHFQIHDSHEST